MQSTYTRHKNLFNFNFPVFNTFWISYSVLLLHIFLHPFFSIQLSELICFSSLTVSWYHTDNCIVNEIMAKVLTKQRLLAKLIVLLLIFLMLSFSKQVSWYSFANLNPFFSGSFYSYMSKSSLVILNICPVLIEMD